MIQAANVEDKIQCLSDYLAKVDEEEKWIDPSRMIKDFSELVRLTGMKGQDKKRHLKYKKEILRLMIERGGYIKTQTDYKTEEAIKMFEAVLRIDSELPLAHYRLGHLYYKLGDYIKSISCFNKAILINEIKCLTVSACYNLDEVQLEHANLFIAINGLRLAHEKEKFIENHTGSYTDQIDDIIMSMENTYRKKELVKYTTGDNKSYISYMDYLNLLEIEDTIVISNIDGTAQIQYVDNIITIEKSIYLFIKLLLRASKKRPIKGSQISVRDSLNLNSTDKQVENTLAVRKRYLAKLINRYDLPIIIENGFVDGRRSGYHAICTINYCFVERESLFSE